MPTAPENPIVCYVTDRKSLSAASTPTNLSESITRAVVAGVNWVQIREKDLPTRDLLQLATAAVKIAKQFSNDRRTQIIVNDRVDIALAAGAGGVHLGHESAPAKAVIAWCRAENTPQDFLVGVSCHSAEDVRNAESAGANYVFFGPIFDTPSKRAFGAAQGLERLAAVCAFAKIPVIAIGGVDETSAEKCLRAGAAGIAAIRFFQDAANVETLKKKIAGLLRAR